MGWPWQTWSSAHLLVWHCHAGSGPGRSASGYWGCSRSPPPSLQNNTSHSLQKQAFMMLYYEKDHNLTPVFDCMWPDHRWNEKKLAIRKYLLHTSMTYTTIHKFKVSKIALASSRDFYIYLIKTAIFLKKSNIFIIFNCFLLNPNVIYSCKGKSWIISSHYSSL